MVVRIGLAAVIHTDGGGNGLGAEFKTSLDIGETVG